MSIDELQQQLDEKDELVTALTQQLEQAAEQLDRMHRSGGRSGLHNAQESKVINPLNEQLSTNLNYLIEQWEESQIASCLERIESQIEDLKSSVSNIQLPAEQSTTTNWSPEDDDNRPTGLQLDALKDVLFGATPEITDEVFDESLNEIEADEDVITSNDPLPPTPAAVDFEQANHEEMISAIQTRDDYIESCIAMYRDLRLKSGLIQPINWEVISECPEELVESLQELESHLREQARLNEVTMSLERARISRESTQLRQYRVQLQKYVKKHNLDPTELPSLGVQLSDESANEKRSSVPNQKWLSLLRIKHQSE
ncbi:MAG TPA: hypothetical protein DD473_05760 [Planctomycetaceae bacterium]|nr:hypothetical protein [Planctomycetaceae bacterium]